MSKLVANPLFQVLYQTELEWGLMKKLCGLVLVPSLKLMQMGHFQPEKKKAASKWFLRHEWGCLKIEDGSPIYGHFIWNMDEPNDD